MRVFFFEPNQSTLMKFSTLPYVKLVENLFSAGVQTGLERRVQSLVDYLEGESSSQSLRDFSILVSNLVGDEPSWLLYALSKISNCAKYRAGLDAGVELYVSLS